MVDVGGVVFGCVGFCVGCVVKVFVGGVMDCVDCWWCVFCC